MSAIIAAGAIGTGGQDRRPRAKPDPKPDPSESAAPQAQRAEAGPPRPEEPEPPAPDLPQGAMFAAGLAAGALPPVLPSPEELTLNSAKGWTAPESPLCLRDRTA